MASLVLYYPHIARFLYRHSRDLKSFLQSSDSVDRTNYHRILVLASMDILLTLPMGVASIVLNTRQSLAYDDGQISFYYGWRDDHADWAPRSVSQADALAGGTSVVAQYYFIQWTSPVLAFVIFALFGATSEARAAYWRVICTIGGCFGWAPTPCTHRARSSLGDIEFGERPPQHSISFGLDSQPSFIDPSARIPQTMTGSITDRSEVAFESTRSDKDWPEDVPRATSGTHRDNDVQDRGAHVVGASQAV
ncbi:unnamed protein product [Peniophora sp. CBMAI 1063]|nr:unnamed protein product [Peniophora sp. CBMAI 1063]